MKQKLTGRCLMATAMLLLSIACTAQIEKVDPKNLQILQDQQFQQQPGNNNVFEPFKDNWPELKRGEHNLVQRFVPQKPDKITVDKKNCIAGVFVLKFTEGTHIRLKDGKLFFDDKNALQNSEEMYRLARSGLKADGITGQLQQVVGILDKARSNYKFDIAYAFRTNKQPYTTDDQFIQKAELEQRAGEELADLDLYYVVYAPNFKDPAAEEDVMNQFNKFGIVEMVYPAMMSTGAVVKSNEKEEFFSPPPPTTDISSMQGYLNAAPTGLDARFAWTQRGGRGDGIRIADVEYDWVTDHEDFPRNWFWGARPVLCPYVREGSEHGTAVMGELAAPDNGMGVTGFVSNVSYGTSTACRPFDYVWASVVASFSGENWVGRCHNVVVANAIVAASDALRPGDVLLIEQHTAGPASGLPCTLGDCSQWEYVPMEYYQECFDAIRRATAAGRLVVEAAGNGSMNLDAPRYGNRFNLSVRNSQAILVGASGMGNRVTANFSNTSGRVDVHAWGGGVVTLGYGGGSPSPFDNTPINRFYTSGFGGTSSASPMVAGSVASIQATRLAAGLPLMSPTNMRSLLVSTGTLQVSGAPIGPQPNLRAAIIRSTGLAGGFSGPGTYTIRSKLTRKVLDIDISWFAGGNNGQKLQQWDSHLGQNQQFTVIDAGGGFFRLMAVHSGKMLDVRGQGLGDGVALQQFQSTGLANQQFRIVPVSSFYKIICRQSNKVLDVTGFGRDNGVQIQQWTDLGGDNQLWEFVRLR